MNYSKMTKTQLIDALNARDVEIADLQEQCNDLNNKFEHEKHRTEELRQKCNVFSNHEERANHEARKAKRELNVAEDQISQLKGRLSIAEIDLWKLLGAFESHGLKHPRIFSRLPIVVEDDGGSESVADVVERFKQ
jgi:chromosome segregation ATPase